MDPLTPSWHAQHTPDAPALVMAATGEAVSYADLDDRSTRLALALRTRGVGPGDHVAVLMENNRALLEVAWAAQRSGLYYTAINSHLRTGEVQYVLDDCGAVALVASEAMAGVVDGLDLSRIPVRMAAVGDLPGFERLDEAVAGEAPGPLADEREGREMLYSSGTTGRPKGVRKELPGTPFGDPSSTPVQLARALALQGRGVGAGASRRSCSRRTRPPPGPGSQPSCSRSARRSWRPTSARAASTSSTSCRATPTASSTSACCASTTGRATTRS
jgi:long-chain acyl-CoA synthetase